jgi:hypothetical protein
MPFKRIFAALMAGLCLSGCSTQMAYHSLQEMQRAQCDKLTDLQELQRCRAQARQSYDDYQHDREREAATPAQ